MISSVLCWILIIFIPMAKFNIIVLQEVFKRPLMLDFDSDDDVDVVTCVYSGANLKCVRYTYDGINVVLINLFLVVLFAIFDGKILKTLLSMEGISSPVAIFVFCVISIVPLSYYIGMAVSSISAQSGFGLGAVINATFGSIVEIILYCFALKDGKRGLVEGSIVGSFLGSMLLLPGFSMLFGGFKRRQLKFNRQSMGVSGTMLVMAVVGALSPTLFYRMYGKFDLICSECDGNSCFNCFYRIMDPLEDVFYLQKTRPLIYFCAAILPTVRSSNL